MPSLYEDKNARARRQRDHTRRKLVCPVCEEVFEVFQGAVQSRKYCKDECSRTANRQRQKARDTQRGPMSHHKAGGRGYDPAARRAEYLRNRDQALAHQKAWRAAHRETLLRRKRDYSRRNAAVKRGKSECASISAFLLVFDRAGYWRASPEGERIGSAETIVARYESTEAIWAVRPPALARPGQSEVVRRLQAAEQRSRGAKCAALVGQRNQA